MNVLDSSAGVLIMVGMDPLHAVTGTIGLLVLVVFLSWPTVKDFIVEQQSRRAEIARARREELNPSAVCQCGHGRAFHAAAPVGAGVCAAEVEGGADCRCQQYVGPEPLPEFHV